MKSRAWLVLITAVTVAAAPETDGLRSGLDTAFSLFSLGSVSIGGEAVPNGSDDAVRFPLTGFLAPHDASMQVTARQNPDGKWDIASLSVPPEGALGTSIDHALSYTIGRQVIHGQIAPDFTAGSAMDATLHDVTFEQNGTPGTIKRLQLHAAGRPDQDRVEANLDGEVDDPSMTTASYAAFTPRRITIQSYAAGLDKAKLTRLIHLMLASRPDRDAVRRQLSQMLAVPGTSVELRSIDLDSGPMHAHATGRLLPGSGGDIGADLHVTATGTDALLSSLAMNPKTRMALPVAFIARGLGKMQGKDVVWDIKIRGEAITVNGLPFGQPSDDSPVRFGQPPDRKR